jgi:hypothetical protein
MLPETDLSAAKKAGGGFPIKKFPSRNSLLKLFFRLYSNGIVPRKLLYLSDNDDSSG